MQFEIAAYRGIGRRAGKPVSVLSYHVNGQLAGQSVESVARLLPGDVPRALIREACRHARDGWAHTIRIGE
jgi:hypothetical protein